MDQSFEQTHQRYQKALNEALEQFKTLLASTSSNQWKPIPSNNAQLNSHTPFTEPIKLNPRNGISPIEFSNVKVHKRKAEGAPIIRAICDLWIEPEKVDVNDFKAILNTPEIRGMWDNLVDKAKVVEVLDSQTRIVKTDFRLGWPANPRDSITITKTFHDSNTIIDISTSLPRSTDEPAYLRPSPPFVRSHIHLLAWCIQLSPHSNPIQSSTIPTVSPDSSISLEEFTTNDQTPKSFTKSSLTRARITVFWKVNWKGAIFSTHHSQIASLLGGFVEYMRIHADRIPILSSYGKGIDFGSTVFDKSEEKLTIEYSIVVMDPPSSSNEGETQNKLNELDHPERAIELKLPINQGWNVHVKSNGQGEGVDETWTTNAERELTSSRTTLRITHAPLTGPHQIVKVKVTAQRLAGGNSLRVNQKVMKPITIETRNQMGNQTVLIDDTKSISNSSLKTDISKPTNDSLSVNESSLDVFSSSTPPSPFPNLIPKRSSSTTRSNVISSLLRRSYIYFSSLLQEPEAKWKHITDSRGVTVTQLQSIDPTLTVYRAEATFVGVGVWNVYSAINTIGARMCWDNSLTSAILLEDLNDLSSLWQIKQKGAWPVAPRDSILITTTYKSPSSVHIFSVSTDDSNLFPNITQPDSGSIRTRTEILGWSIESLSPTTTQITLIDQHDPMGWSPKSWTPAQLISQVSSVGEYSMKSGGPPIITRILGAKIKLSKYEQEKGIFRAEYSTKDGILSSSHMEDSINKSDHLNDNLDLNDLNMIECEIRCDCEIWANSLDIVVNPPPTKATCLKRHKLSSGGGWWVMIEHDSTLLLNDTARISIRRGSSQVKDKGSVTLNGTSLRVDIEEISEDEAIRLSKSRRVKSSLIPLDQYSLSGPRLWRNSPCVSPPTTRSNTPVPDQKTDQEVLGSLTPLTPTTTTTTTSPNSITTQSGSPPAIPPMICALEALARLQAFHIEQGPDIMVPPVGWTLVAEKGNSSVYKKIVPQISEIFPVYRGDRVIEGVTAEEMVSALSAFTSRPIWDDRIESSYLLESYGHGCSTLILTTKPNFPFKGRLLQLAHVNAQMQVPSSSVTSSTTTVHFIASTSFSRPSDSTFSNQKINPQGLVEGNVLLEGWIMETIDPYSVSFHAIPSTRCTYFSAIDYRGSVPVAFNSMLNSSLPRLISGVEKLVKLHGPLPKLCRPTLNLQIDGPLGTDGMDDWEWRIKTGHRPITAIAADATNSGVFRVTLLVPKESNEPHLNNAASVPISPAGSSKTPNSRYDVVRQLRGKASSANEGKVVRRLVSNPDLRPKTSVGNVRRTTGVSNVPNSHSLNVSSTLPGDLVISEITLDRKLYPNGFQIIWTSNFLKENKPAELDQTLKSLEVQNHELLSTSADISGLPIQVSIHEMPSPAVFAASLDSGAKREHLLLRMTLPVTSIHSPIHDPLMTSETNEVKLPTWYTQLSKKNALVKLSVEPITLPDGEIDNNNNDQDQNSIKTIKSIKQVLVNGKLIEIIPLLQSQTELDRWEIDDYTVTPCSISRMTRAIKSATAPSPSSITSSSLFDALPVVLQRPAAIATEFLTLSHPGQLSPLVVGSVVGSPQNLSPVLEQVEVCEDQLGKICQSGTNLLTGDGTNYMRPGTLTPIINFIQISPINNIIIPIWNTLTKSRTYTKRHMIITSIIFFLLGSLIRSLILPNDLIIIPPNLNDKENRLIHYLSSKNHWNEIKKLIEIRFFFFLKSWTFILAAVRTNT